MVHISNDYLCIVLLSWTPLGNLCCRSVLLASFELISVLNLILIPIYVLVNSVIVCLFDVLYLNLPK